MFGILYLAKYCCTLVLEHSTSRNCFRLRAGLSASFFRMGSSSSPSKRTIEARRTKQRRKTAAIRWTKRRKRQERCCREVRRRRARWRVWTSFGGGGADTPPEMFPSTPLYIRNTWGLIYKHCLVWKFEFILGKLYDVMLKRSQSTAFW